MKPKPKRINIFLNDEIDSEFKEDFFKNIVFGIFHFVDYPLDECQVSLTLTDDENIRTLNKEYRGIDKSTDVLSFPLNAEKIEDSLLGDVVISIEHAKNYAESNGFPVNREVAFLFIHGFLHLLGYDHEKSLDDEERMFTLQEKILKYLIDKGVCD